MSGTNTANNPDDDDDNETSYPDDLSALCGFLADKLSPEDMADANNLIENLCNSFGAPDDDDSETASDKLRRPRIGILSKDSKMVDKQTIRALQAIKTAEEEVAPHVGAVMGADSAFGVYRTALKRIGYSDIPALMGSAAAARQVFLGLCRQPRRSVMGADSASAVSKRSQMFPNANRLRTGYY